MKQNAFSVLTRSCRKDNPYQKYLSSSLIQRQRRRLFCSSSLSSFSSFTDNSRVNEDIIIKQLPWQYIRAMDETKFDSTTQQRTDVIYDSHSGKPILSNTKQSSSTTKPPTIQSYSVDDTKKCHIVWNDGVTTTNDYNVLEQSYHHWKQTQQSSSSSTENNDDRILWTNLSEEDVRTNSEMTLSFDALIYNDSGMRHGLKALYKYGILLITNTPIDDNGVGIATIGAALGGGKIKTISNSILAANYYRTENKKNHIVLPDGGTDGPLRTLYGHVWSTSSSTQSDGTSIADSAYGSDGLPLHTDFTYHMYPPGLQIFTMIQPAIEGGESVFGDGYAVAETLRQTNPNAFHILSTTIRTYHSKDEMTGWDLQGSGPVIVMKHGRVIGIRHNDLDRLPDLSPSHVVDPNDIDAFYNDLETAHTAWDSLLAQDEFRLEMKLQPGDTMVVANHRCFHGRKNFSTSTQHPRIVMGCYVSQDELSSRFRMEGFKVIS